MKQGLGAPGLARSVLLLLLVLPVCTSCAARRFESCDKPPPFYLRLQAAERLNTDPRGRSMPTLVQVLQLRDSHQIEQATFRGLWDKPEALLKEDFLRAAEFTVAPGQEVKRWVPRDPKAQFVVVMGLFRKPSGPYWKALAELPAVPKHLCTEEPVGQRGPRASDEQLHFKLEGYQIDTLRGAPSSPDNPVPDLPEGGLSPQWSKS